MTSDPPVPGAPADTQDGSRARHLRLAVALSFPIAFAIHDAEEVLAAGPWHRRAPSVLRERFPRVPQRVVAAAAVTPQRMKDAVAVVSCAVAAVTAVSLARTDTTPRLLRSAVAVFGAHSITHVAQALVLRSYTPGVATALAVVAPYSVWAWKALNIADPDAGRGFIATALRAAPAVLLLASLAQAAAAANAHRRTVNGTPNDPAAAGA